MDKHNLTPEELTKYQKHFTESDFWFKASTLAKKAGVKITYYALVLYYTLTDPGTPTRYKAVIAGALGYMILPLDLVPDFIPAYVATAITPEIKARAKDKAEEWFGPILDSQLGDDDLR